MKRILHALLLAGAAAVLAGCASSYRLDSTVQSFSGLPTLPATPTYRFERLPSQLGASQDQLEAIADPALFRSGLRRDDSAPKFSVLVSARVQRVISPWSDPWYGPGMGWHGAGYWGPRWAGPGFGPYSGMDQPWYSREVSVLVRDLASSKVVFESHANSDGPYLDNATALAAMFEAAMHGFPNPPIGPRRVDVQIATGQRAQAAAPAASAPASGAPATAPATR
jgi:hypothetical protein